MPENIMEFKKEQFDEMLLNDKQKLIDLIKNEKIIKIFYSPQRFFNYKIFIKQNDDLFIKKDDNQTLSEVIKPIILHDVDINNTNILRENFRFWYFLGNEVSFYKTVFHGKQTNFQRLYLLMTGLIFLHLNLKVKEPIFQP